MSGTLSGSELFHALLPGERRRLKRRMFDLATISLVNDVLVRVSVQTTDGQYHYLEISTRISTEGPSASSGSDTA